MVRMAYRDAAKTDLVYARDLHALNLDVEYFCPGRECPARLRLQQGNGADANAATFSARHGSVAHRQYCIHSSRVQSEYDIPKPFAADLIDRDNFDFEVAIKALVETNAGDYVDNKRRSVASVAGSNGASLRLRHISQIYLMLKDMHVDDEIAGMRVGEMLCDSRSFAGYHQDVREGFYICESYKNAIRWCYDSRILEVRTRITGDNRYMRLRFDDWTNYRKMQKFVYENEDRNVVVAGDWHFEQGDSIPDDPAMRDERAFPYEAIVCTVHNDRQYFLCR